jgi:serine acetyltransferase
VCEDVIVGMNSGVVKDIKEPGTYIGTPAKKIK